MKDTTRILITDSYLQILDKLYRLIEIDGSNLVSTNQVMEFISHLTNSRPRTGFDKSSLARLEQLFRTTVGNEQEIRREEFQKIVTSKNVGKSNILRHF